MVSPAGFEPTAPRLGIWCSIRLSYEDPPYAYHGGPRAGRTGARPFARAKEPERRSRVFRGSVSLGECALATSPRDTYITGLVNAHALENQAVSILSRQVERLESYPEMSDQIRLHIDESKTQAQRIEEILQSLGTSHSSLKDLVTSFTGNMAALAHAPMQDEVMKNTFANFAFEHFEIASYKALLEMADAAGDGRAPQLLKQSLNEEVQMAQWIDQHLPETVRTYMRLESSGQTAGV